jgi:SAM-dependent methyltransferase
MLLGASGVLFPPLEKSDHFPYLVHLVRQLPPDSSVVELGCGAGAFQRAYSGFFYMGADLDHIVKQVASRFNPEAKVISCDIYTDPVDFIRLFDVVLMNAFIDIMEHPLEILDKVLQRSTDYVLLHRQEIDSGPTRITTNPSYGGTTFHSIINESDFSTLLQENHFSVLDKVRVACYSDNTTFSLLLKKND